MACQYKDLFGKPKEGIHKYRLFGIAIFDVIVTILVSILIAYIFNLNLWITLITLFLIGIIVHRIFCVRTTIDKLLFS